VILTPFFRLVPRTKMRFSVHLFPLCLQCVDKDNFTFFRSVCKIAKNDYYFRHVCLSAFPSVRPYGTSRIPLKLRKSVDRIVISLKSNKHNGTSRDYLRVIMIIWRRVFLRMRNFQSCRENQKPIFGKISPFEILWKICVTDGQITDDNVIRRMDLHAG